MTTARWITRPIPKNIIRCSLSLKIEGIAAILTMTDNAAEISGAV